MSLSYSWLIKLIRFKILELVKRLSRAGEGRGAAPSVSLIAFVRQSTACLAWGTATEQGLATCWVCNFDADKCRELFTFDSNEEPAVLIPIGYAADEPKEKNRKDITEILK